MNTPNIRFKGYTDACSEKLYDIIYTRRIDKWTVEKTEKHYC